MKITAAKYIGGQLILDTQDRDAVKIAYNFKPGDYQITKAKKPRSLDANGYCWALCTEISRAVGVSKEEVYRRAIRDVGEFTALPIRADAVEAFGRIWAGKGIGWFVEVVDNSKLPGYKRVFAYHGSSCYDVSQMHRLIDYLIEDARAVGVDVISEREKSLLLEGWNEKQKDASA